MGERPWWESPPPAAAPTEEEEDWRWELGDDEAFDPELDVRAAARRELERLRRRSGKLGT